MPRVRLTGLLLFITALLLCMAAAATRTSHVRVKQADHAAVEQSPDPSAGPAEQQPLRFVSVPIYYPLVVVAAVGLLLWFVPAAMIPQPQYKRRKYSYRRTQKNSLLGWLSPSSKKRRPS